MWIEGTSVYTDPMLNSFGGNVPFIRSRKYPLPEEYVRNGRISREELVEFLKSINEAVPAEELPEWVELSAPQQKKSSYMKTAIITGASAGLGLEFVSQLEDNFPEIECLWLISRSADKLEKAAALLKRAEARILPLDLCSEADLDRLESELQQAKPEIMLLVNNAGCGHLGNVGESGYRTETRMVDLNIRALTAVSNMCVPFMARGGKIINMSSIASFCPNPRMTVYSSSKAYVSAFSRGLGEELKPNGVTVTSVCSGPMGTEFLDIAGIRGNSKTFDTLPWCEPKKVVAGAYKAAKAGKAVHTPRAFFKLYRVIAKILPQFFMVKFAKT